MSNSKKTSHTAAFTLVELSIVLVILGLLVGGVLGGQSLIRAAELRSVSSEFNRYTTAMGIFRDKYFALPGDMNNAQSFWTNAVGNGNGNGQINAVNTNAGNHNGTPNEISAFWMHLSAAALVEGTYTATAASATTMVVGTNNPRARLAGAAWNIVGLGSVGVTGAPSFTTVGFVPAANVFADNNYGNALILGAGTDPVAMTGVLRAEEAWNLDIKMDDGRPAMGSINSLESQGNTTVTAAVCSNLSQDNAATVAAAAYHLAGTSATACTLVMKTGY